VNHNEGPGGWAGGLNRGRSRHKKLRRKKCREGNMGMKTKLGKGRGNQIGMAEDGGPAIENSEKKRQEGGGALRSQYWNQT